MKLQILKENLHQAVGLVSRFTAQKAQLPVLSHVGIVAEGKELYFMGTDLDVGIRLRVGGKVLEKGSIAIPSRVFSELVGVLPLGAVELESDSKSMLKLKAGKVKAQLQGMGMEEFPEFEVGKGSKNVVGAFSVDDLAYYANRVGFAVSNDDTRPVLTGILWDLKKRRMVATDGYRLSIVEKKMEKASGDVGEPELLIGGGLFQEAVKVMDDLGEEKVKVMYEPQKKQVQFVGGDVVMVGRVLQGEYPQFEAILPKEARIVADMDRSELLQAVKTAAIFARDSAHIVRLSVEKKQVVVSANAPQVGENTVVVEAVAENGGEGAIAFNSRYLSDFLSHGESERIVLKMNEALKPGMFMEKGNEHYRHVIMPVRVREEEEK